jgi:uncharacterized protein (DUF362 family)
MPVFFDEVAKYNRLLIADSMVRAFRELEISFSGKKSAFVKVNIVRPARPGSCVVTHPVVVEALIHVLRELGLSRITIGDGPAAGVDGKTAFRKSGYLDLAKKMKVPLLDLHRAERVKKEWEYGLVELPVELINSDLYINVAKMKTHFHTGVTLAVKSQQGLLTPQAKKANHRDYDLHQSLICLAKAIQPDLVIVDAIDSMEGEGPTKGKKKHTKVLVYGNDMVETDIACCHFMGVSPSQIQYLNEAIEERLGTAKPEIRGKAFEENQSVFEMPSPKPKHILNFYSWKNYRACAEDEHSFEQAIHLALMTPKYWFTFFPKFMYLVLFKRFDLLRGKNAKIPRGAGHTLCIGECCRDLASGNGMYHVPGCPPKPEDILNAITRMKKKKV